MNVRVLVVDDSLTVRMNLSEALEAADLVPVVCATAQEARRCLADEAPFGLIILDVLLPDADGVDLLEEIRETPQWADTAIMLLSTKAQVRDRVRGLKTGADEYIGKPYEASYVVSRARELLRRGQAADAEARETILIIDDSPTFRGRLQDALEGAGYGVLIAGSGEEGLRLAADARPTAMIVDGMLPGIDGVSVMRRIRMDVALRHTPCILLTASDERGAEVRALDAGADAFVRKDQDIAVVLARLGAVVRSAGEGWAETHARTSLLGPKKILAVDDSETYLQALAGELRMEGYEVVLARSGEEALDLLSAQSVDCILLDLLMPGIGGHETCRRIKASPFSRTIPVVLLTALEGSDAMIEGLGAGADDYIAKSNEFEVLRARVLAQIRRKQFEDENRLFRDQLVRKELEAVEARTARELSEMQAVMVERKRSQEIMNGLQAELAHVSRWNAMGMMASTLAHEINQPLAAIMNYINAAHYTINKLDAPQIGPALELMNQAKDQAKQAGAIIANLREFIEKREVNRTRESLHKVVEEAIALGLVGGEQTGVKVHVALDPALPPLIVNKVQIQQVLVNLFRNSIDAMQSVSRRELTIAIGMSEPGYVGVAISDTGPGIAPEIAGNLFEPFATTKQNGMGLGLKICQSIIEAHDGKIWLTPNPGAGVTFHFHLPIEDTAEAFVKTAG
jgi:DNA-binding response OmpR family regulator